MKSKSAYLLLGVAGLVLPYWQFLPWVAEHGWNLRLLLQQLFANRIGGFFGMDVIVSALVLVVFMGAENSRVKLGRRRWLPVLALLTVGVSLALPLYLYLRELSLEHTGGGTRTATA
jgi:uncharacterized protein DUF2834